MSLQQVPLKSENTTNSGAINAQAKHNATAVHLVYYIDEFMLNYV